MSDEGTDWNLIPFHLTQDPIHGETATPAMSAGNGQGCATLGVAVFDLGEHKVTNGSGIHTGVAPTLDTYVNRGVSDGMAVRRLLPVECERLQGFPDHWTTGRSDSARYRLLGNAVCVPVAAWIGRRLADA
jgi:DNA (cytosine-5)-methyltransferase 1